MKHITQGTYTLDGVEHTFRLTTDHELSRAEIKEGILAGAQGEFRLGAYSHTIEA